MADVVEAAEQIVAESRLNRAMEIALWVYVGFALGYLIARAWTRQSSRNVIREALEAL